METLNEAGEKPTYEEMVLLRLKKTPLRILLHVITMLTKLTCALKVTFCDGKTGIKDGNSEDTLCDEEKFSALKGSKRVDTIPVTSVMNKSKY